MWWKRKNAAAALEILKQDSDLRLLFSDVGLPGGVNGIELAQQAVRMRPGP